MCGGPCESWLDVEMPLLLESGRTGEVFRRVGRARKDICTAQCYDEGVRGILQKDDFKHRG